MSFFNLQDAICQHSCKLLNFMNILQNYTNYKLHIIILSMDCSDVIFVINWPTIPSLSVVGRKTEHFFNCWYGFLFSNFKSYMSPCNFVNSLKFFFPKTLVRINNILFSVTSYTGNKKQVLSFLINTDLP